MSGSDRAFSSCSSRFWRLDFEAFVDTNGDGFRPGDLMGTYEDTPYKSDSMILTISILPSVPADGKMPSIPLPPSKYSKIFVNFESKLCLSE